MHDLAKFGVSADVEIAYSGSYEVLPSHGRVLVDLPRQGGNRGLLPVLFRFDRNPVVDFLASFGNVVRVVRLLRFGLFVRVGVGAVLPLMS